MSDTSTVHHLPGLVSHSQQMAYAKVAFRNLAVWVPSMYAGVVAARVAFKKELVTTAGHIDEERDRK
jgi:hypothetical protein